MSTPIFRIEVAPLTPLPIHRSVLFSYRSMTAIPSGSLVAISFGRRQLQGIVFASKRLPGKAPLWMKPISAIIAPSWLSPEQLSLAQMLSEMYFSSLGNTLKHFVFSLPKTKTQSLLPQKLQKPIKRRRSSTYKTIVPNCPTDTLLWKTLDKELISSTTHGTVLVLVPNLLLAEYLSKQYPESLLITSRLSKKKLFDTWEVLRSGQARYIFGTRQSLFAPFTSLRKIIILFPEETLSYKQWDMTPRYSALSVAHMLCQLFGSTLTLLTPSPGLREQSLLREKNSQTVPIPLIIDRRKDGKGARSRAFAKPLQALLEKTGSDKKILLIAKERGVSGLMLCHSCRTLARCPHCNHVLGEASGGHLRCLTCGFASDLFPQCRQCGALNFIPFGFGTIRVEREVEKLLLGRRILRIDRDTLSTTPSWKACIRQLENKNFDVIITTHEIGTLLPLPPMHLIAMLEGDHVLRHPEYDSEERLSLETRRLIAKLDTGGVLIIQTFTPEERVWKHVAEGTWSELYSNLLEERDLLGYPPTTAMIQLSPFAHGKNLISSQSLEKKRAELKNILKSHPDFRVPSVLVRPNIKGSVSHQSIIIKYPTSASLPASLITWIKQHAHELAPDRDPYQL